MSAAQELMNAVVSSPTALFVGVAIGFAASKMTGRRRNQGMGMM